MCRSVIIALDIPGERSIPARNGDRDLRIYAAFPSPDLTERSRHLQVSYDAGIVHLDEIDCGSWDWLVVSSANEWSRVMMICAVV